MKKFLLYTLAVVGVISIILIIILIMVPLGPTPEILEFNESGPIPVLIEDEVLTPKFKIEDPDQRDMGGDISTFSAHLSNEGEDGEVLVTLKLRDKNNLPIKEYSETYYLVFGETIKVEFFVETPLRMVSFVFEIESTGLIEYYALIKNEGEPGQISVILELSDDKHKIIRQYNQTYFLEANESEPISFFVETPPEASLYQFSFAVTEDYYTLIKNEGEEGEICVILTFFDKNNQVIKEYKTTDYLESSEESRLVNFFIEAPEQTVSYVPSVMVGAC